MRTITTQTTVYLFEELTEEAQQKAIEQYSYINVEFFEWWDSVYEDAENIGLKITEFDLDRNRYAKGDFINSALETAEQIFTNHGEHCETYKTAQEYIEERNKIVYAMDPEDYNEPDTEDIDSDFLRSLCEDYSIMLQKEYEYLTGEEAIKETLICNEYEFTEDGKIY